MSALHAKALIDPDNYRFLQDYVRSESGIVLDEEKHYLLDARLTGVARDQGLSSLDALCAVLRKSSTSPLHQRVLEAMTTNETFFFREPIQYDALKHQVLPPLIEERRATKRLSFWSAASSTGQEAYSLAMMLLEMGLGGWSIDILGTDFSAQVIDRAKSGRYLQIEVNRGLPTTLLVKYFRRAGVDWELKDEVKRMVRFHTTDLRKSMRTLGPFDVVFCRNVLIYFDPETKRKITEQIHSTLFRGGYLLLGGSESAFNLEGLFERRTMNGATLYEAIG